MLRPTRQPAPIFQPGSKILVNIDKSTQEMTVFVDGMERYTLGRFRRARDTRHAGGDLYAHVHE